jgi:RNA polymerase sigma-70 factor (ECF subfamily)
MRPSVSPSGELADALLAHADALFNLARYLSGNDADAEDLVQEAYARAFAAVQSFHGGNAKAWIFRILRNTFIDVYRKGQRSAALGVIDVLDGAPDVLRGDVEIEQLRRVVAEDIEAALMHVSEEARTVILLDLEGFTEVEVAEVLGCAVGTVKSRLARARMVLRQRLADYAR